MTVVYTNGHANRPINAFIELLREIDVETHARDTLIVRRIDVLDIMTPGRTRAHRLTPFAHVEGMLITYPDAEESEEG